MTVPFSRPRLLAVLGPTNTGKTHFAVERMLGHRTGMIGFPLRLLARENYDRVVRVKGRERTALITGEERIVPTNPAYFLCTVEAMPLERRVSFLAIDEVQLAADPDRGHLFTERLLHARGLDETMFLGSDTMRPLLRGLVREAEFLDRPRFSRLAHAGAKRLVRLPPRSAVVAFTADEVYALADVVRRQKGGAAVVLGALSPRARNAQVAMYENGEVDYLVATDAIGMGLNMDIDHVAFAALSKFDGRTVRPLGAAEVAQIAGRAGRHMSDGTFGTTADARPLDAAIVEAVENHRFPALAAIWWRNPDLRLHSLDALRASLAVRPPSPALQRVRNAEDERTLEALARDPRIAALASTPEAVRRLWEVCQIPDYRKTMTDDHAGMLSRIYRHLMEGGGRLPADWVADRIARLDRTDGDIDTLATRIAYIRTWTFISNRGAWLDDPRHWQERTRAVEDRLSDALHHRLTQRFVDRRTHVLLRRLKDAGPVRAAIETAADGTGEVYVEGEYLGRLVGLRFAPDRTSTGAAERTLMAAARRALRGEVQRRVLALVADPDDAFAFDARGRILWRGAPVGRLVAGDAPLSPKARPYADDLLDEGARRILGRRLSQWAEQAVAAGLRPLFALRDAAAGDPAYSGAARGLVFQLGEAMGSLERRTAAPLVAALTPGDTNGLWGRGVRIGRRAVYLIASLKPEAVRLRALLWSVANGLEEVPALPPPSRVSVPLEPTLPRGFYEGTGFLVAGRRAVRADILEKLLAEATRLARKGPFAATPSLLARAGCGPVDLASILLASGFGAREEAGGTMFFLPKRGRKGRAERRSKGAGALDSPFAELNRLRPGR